MENNHNAKNDISDKSVDSDKSTENLDKQTDVATEDASHEANGGSQKAILTQESIEINKESKSQTKGENKQKVDILFKPTGSAPIIVKKRWTVDADKTLGSVIIFMGKYMKLEQHQQLFVYVNQTFAPSPDQTVRNLFDCYSTEGKLVLHYCLTQAWG